MTTIFDLTKEERIRQDDISKLRLKREYHGLNNMEKEMLGKLEAQQTENEKSHRRTGGT